jgi:peptide/nickel transport system ATP-binding protein
VTGPSLLEIGGLDLRFRGFEGSAHVLRGIEFGLEAGERVGLVGESGCGKSVLLRSILGLHDRRRSALSGSIRFEGEELVGRGERAMRGLRGKRITMIFQDPSAALNPVFTIGDQLADVVLQHGTAPDRRAADALLREALRAVSIDEPDRVLASYPFQLSGGMNQRVMITMALVNAPRLILADEPGTALDVSVQEQTLRLMRQLTEASGTAVLMITHNLGVVREFAQRVAVMYAGTIVEEAPCDALFAAPRHPYTRALLDAVPRMTGGALPAPIAGAMPDYLQPPPGCRFAPRCPHARPACDAPPPVVTVDPGHHVACVLYA